MKKKNKPKSSSGFLKLFDVDIEATITFHAQVYGDDSVDAKELAIGRLDDIIPKDMGLVIKKTVVVKSPEEK